MSSFLLKTFFRNLIEMRLLPHFIVNVTYVSRCKEDDMAITWDEIVRAGAQDSEYSAVKKAILEGFPEKPEECIPLIQPFYKNRRNLSVVVEDKLEVVVYHDSDLRSRMLIPKSLRNRVKQILHADHRRDLTRVKRRAQEHVYWPNMAAELKIFIDQCVHCQVNMPSHAREPLVPTKAPVYPFQMVACDYFEVDQHSYMVYVDRYSGWIGTVTSLLGRVCLLS